MTCVFSALAILHIVNDLTCVINHVMITITMCHVLSDAVIELLRGWGVQPSQQFYQSPLEMMH